ncbi:MAG: BatA domain-containing protein [Bacteroidia bacterium]|nr:BatA domain-containing protein [Bacteroidia bacterium]
MHFVHPQILWWLFAMAIPVIVHLFNFRRHRTLLFSDVRLLKNLQQQTNKQRKIKHLLILLMRVLAVAALVIAFARPYLKSGDAPDEGLKHISVYLDNSLSMQLRADRMSVLDELRSQAGSLPSAFRMDDRFSLLSNDFLPQHQRFMSAAEFQQELQQVRPNAAGVSLGQVLQRLQMNESADNRAGRLIYLLSDFQRSALNFDQLIADSSLRLFLVQGIPARKNNISLDTCWLENPVLLPGQPIEFHVRLTNWGETIAEALPVALSVNGVQKASSTIDIEARRSTQIVLQYFPETSGYHEATISVVDDPVTFDDELYLSFEVRKALPVLEIYEKKPNTYLGLLLGDDPQVEFQTAQRLRLDVQMLDYYETIFLSGLEEINSGLERALTEFVSNGGNLVIFPSEIDNSSIAAFSAQLGILFGAQSDTTRSRVNMLQTEHPLLKGALGKVPDNAEFPWLRRWYSLEAAEGSPAQAPARLLNGKPLLLASPKEQGLVYAYAAPLESSWTNLMNNNLFVALIYRTILLSNRNASLYHLIDGPVKTPLGSYIYNDRVRLELRAQDQSVRILPELTSLGERTIAVVYPELLRPGFYGLYAGDSLLLRLAINESRKESVMDFATAEEVKRQLQEKGYKHIDILRPDARGLGEAVSDFLTGRPIHQLFVLLTLLFLLGEVLIIRFFR